METEAVCGKCEGLGRATCVSKCGSNSQLRKFFLVDGATRWKTGSACRNIFINCGAELDARLTDSNDAQLTDSNDAQLTVSSCALLSCGGLLLVISVKMSCLCS